MMKARGVRTATDTCCYGDDYASSICVITINFTTVGNSRNILNLKWVISIIYSTKKHDLIKTDRN